MDTLTNAMRLAAILEAVVVAIGLFAAQTDSATAQDPCFYYSDGNPCKVRALGYDGELTAKGGHCINRTCVVDEIPFGCSGRPRQQRGSRIGCAYTCWKNNKLHFGYKEVGETCVHMDSFSAVTTTCKKAGNKVLCRESITDADMHGC
uniref:Putative secreted protein n=1 Tax=Amblyomma triste TaxID=251400 RepID=A0A023G2C7_AMBTT